MCKMSAQKENGQARSNLFFHLKTSPVSFFMVHVDIFITHSIYFRYMNKTIINIKIDKEVKENAQKLAKELGFSLSDVVNASLRNFIRTQGVHFSAVPHMTSELEHLLVGVEKDMQENKNMSGPFSTHTEVHEHLDSL